MKKNLMIIGILSLGLLVSCSKKGESYPQAEAESWLKTDNRIEDTGSEIDIITEEALTFPTTRAVSSPINGQNFLTSLVQVTFDSTLQFKRMVIDFGRGMMCTDGKYRSGKIIVRVYPNQNLNRPNVLQTILFDHYTVDSVQVFGRIEKTLTYLELPLEKRSTYKEYLKVVMPGATDSISVQSQRIRTYYCGQVEDVRDNRIITKGTSTTTFPDGKFVQKSIDANHPLVFSVVRKVNVKGIKTINYNNEKSVQIDFGYGTWYEALKTVNGESVVIDLRKR